MRKTLLTGIVMSMAICLTQAQNKTFWTKSSEPPVRVATGRVQPSEYTVFTLDVTGLQRELSAAPAREHTSGRSTNLIITFPTPDGTLERFNVVEASVMHPDLAAKYPMIHSYAGQGLDDPGATIRFSLSDQAGFHGMILSGTKSTYFIDPYSPDHKTYRVYSRKSLAGAPGLECFTEAELSPAGAQRGDINAKTNDKKLRKYRLALSCNAEYGNIFAGTGTDAQKRANILAQMNITMTRVNGVYERDLAVILEMIPNNDTIVFFGSTSSDPWSGEFNTKTQQVIDSYIGNANYDIGHNFNTSGGGNAGCIGCVCVTGSKGSGYTGSSNPVGDPFDIDYVAHEMGHQFGGYHTQANVSCRSGSGTTEVEPGSASTIMGYAGVCATNVQNNSDAYFHYVNIRDISANIQTGASSGCAQVVNLTNNPPTANAGADYVIPKSTPFVLRGQGSDPDGDVITYTWEQNDPESSSWNSNNPPTSTKTSGPMFRSWEGTTSPDRYMPRISDVVAGNITPTWEVVPSVARTLNFALTVKDNHAGGGQTSDDLMVVTVNGTAGPFTVSSPNSAITWAVGSSQTVTWNVASTNVAPVNCANVNILLSTDGGFTYPVTLISNTPNDGSQSVTVPNNVSTTCRVKIEAVGNIFYDISNANFTISGSVSCSPTVPTGLAASGITANTATLSWAAVSGASYDVQYRPVGSSTWTLISTSEVSVALTGLTAATTYEAQVRSKCTSDSSAFSASVNFTTSTVTLNYCTSKGNSVTDEYIGRVQLGTINNASGANAGYGNFTSLSTNLTKGSANTITVTPTWTGTTYNEGYSAWIDYNQDGDFTDSGEQVWTRTATRTTPVSGSFTVPSTALSGTTRLRVSMKYNAIPTSCETFSFGEVEDYTVNITAASGGTCTNVTLALTFDDYPEETSWRITNAAGTTVASGGPYSTAPDRSTLTVVSCLEAGCYTFTISDAFGDGICCTYGNGSYNVTNDAGAVLASGSSFTSSQSTNICVGGASSTARGEVYSETKDNRVHFYPNPVKDNLNVDIPEGIAVRSLAITATNGLVIKSVQRDTKVINVSSFPTGMYILSIETTKGFIREKFIKE